MIKWSEFDKMAKCQFMTCLLTATDVKSLQIRDTLPFAICEATKKVL